MIKRVISLVLSLVIVLSFVPASGITTHAAEGMNRQAGTINIPENAFCWNAHYYAVFDNCNSWDEAERYCQSLGGHLATITSAEENAAVFGYVTSLGYKSAYFGLTDAEKEGTWKWVTGEKLDYLNWHSGEPNCESSREDYAMFYYKYSDGKWNDGDFGGSTVNGGKAFICEWDLENDTTPAEKLSTFNALNALLIGVEYYPSLQATEVSQWSNETICDVIWNKLLWDDYHFSDSSYLSKIGLEYRTDNDGYLHFDLDTIQRITRDTLGVDFPSETKSDYIFVSGEELLIAQAIGESRSLLIQDFIKSGRKVIAVGIAVHHNNADSEFLGYFEAVFEENASSVYGYTLHSLSSLESNQNFEKLTASASSELKEETTTHYAGNVLDKDLGTAWAEGVNGVGRNEWIKLETTDRSNMDVSAIQFSMGYHKNNQALQNNGWPYKVHIETEGGYSQTAEFYDYTDIVVFDQAVTTSWIKITILEASTGKKYDDTCISEISLLGIDTSVFFQGYEDSLDYVPEKRIKYMTYLSPGMEQANTQYFRYNETGYLTSIDTKDQNGNHIQTREFVYDQFGHFLYEETTKSWKIPYEYDENGNLLVKREWVPGDMIIETVYTYHPNGGLCYSVERYIHVATEDIQFETRTDYELDSLNRVIKSIAPNNTKHYSYDASGKKISCYEEEKERTTYYQYDQYGRLVKERTVSKNGTEYDLEYDYENYKPFVAAFGRDDEYAYDALTLKDAAGNVVWGFCGDWGLDGEIKVSVTADDYVATVEHFGYDEYACEFFYERNPLSDTWEFQQSKYRADYLLKNQLDHYMGMISPSRTLFETGEIQVTNDIWTNVTLAIDTFISGDAAIKHYYEQSDLYEAILLNALESATNTPEAELWKISEFKRITGDASKFMSLLKDTMLLEIDWEMATDQKVADMTPKQKEIFKKQLKESADTGGIISQTEKAAKIYKLADTILDSATTVENAVLLCFTYANLWNYIDYMAEVLDEMYVQTPDTGEYDHMRQALSFCSRMIKETSREQFEEGAIIHACEEALGEDVIARGISIVWEKTIGSMIKGNAKLKVLLFAYKFGKVAANWLTNVDAISEQTFKVVATEYYYRSLVPAVHALTQQYQSERSVDNAERLLNSVMLLFGFALGDCDTAYGYADTVDDALMYQISEKLKEVVDWFSGSGNNENSAERMKKQSLSIKADFIREKENFETRDWISRLEYDYPDIFPQYAELIDIEIQKPLVVPLTSSYEIACPVNVSVYDADGNLVVDLSQTDFYYGENIRALRIGDKKYIDVSSESKYTIQCMGYDTGTMNVTVRIYNGSEELRTASFVELPVTETATYELISITDSEDKNRYTINDGETDIPADKDSYLDADSECEHKAVTNAMVPPTCTEPGLTEGSHCETCGEILIPQEEIPPLGHKEETVPGKKPTCTVPGLSEGIHCITCGEILRPQDEIPPRGHDYMRATCSEPETCRICGETWGEPEEHEWEATDCEVSRWCIKCGELDTEWQDHIWDAPDRFCLKTCTVCGKRMCQSHQWIIDNYGVQECPFCYEYIGIVGGPQITVLGTTAAPGDTVTIEVVSSPGFRDIVSLEINDFDYDSKKLEFLGVELILGDGIGVWDEEKKEALFQFEENTDIRSSKVMTFTFRVKDDATGNANVSCQSDALRINFEGNLIPLIQLVTVPGHISIEPAACAHNWTEADCEKPRTCSICGATEGEPLGHKWVDATCETAKTCSACQKTEGDPLGHQFVDGVCSGCGKKKASVSAYADVVRQTVDSMSEGGYGALYDVDGDGTEELIMVYFTMVPNPGANGKMPVTAYSIYTIKDNTVIPLAEQVELHMEAGGAGGSVEIVEIDGVTHIASRIRYWEAGPVSTTEGTWSVYLLKGTTLEKATEISFCEKYDEMKACVLYDKSYAVFDGVKQDYSAMEAWLDELTSVMTVSRWGNEDDDRVIPLQELLDDLLAQEPSEAVAGDVNGDGKADYSDALLILRASIGLEEITEEQKRIADVTGDGKPDYSDALKILRASIGLETLN